MEFHEYVCLVPERTSWQSTLFNNDCIIRNTGIFNRNSVSFHTCRKFAGQRSNSLQEKVMAKNCFTKPGPILIYPFNLVYAMGYFPPLKFVTANWVNEESVEEMIGKLKGERLMNRGFGGL